MEVSRLWFCRRNIYDFLNRSKFRVWQTFYERMVDLKIFEASPGKGKGQ